NFFATTAPATPTNSTAVEIGNGAIVNAFSYSQAAGTGSTVSTIVLDSNASATTDFYRGLIVRWNGQDRIITAYDATTKTVTVGAVAGSAAAWSNAPAAGDAFSIRSPAFQNNGSLLACQPQCGTVSLGGAETGTTTSLLIQPFATLPTFVNTGTLT